MNLKNLLTILMIFSFSFILCGEEMYNDFTQTDTGLKYKITSSGNGKQAKAGDTVVMHYTGKLENGDIFDSSYKRDEPFSFTLGQGRVIKGWEEGVALLHTGDKATFVIPPNLGYGSQRVGTIPAESTLIFDVELLEIKRVEEYSVEGLELHSTDSGLQYYIVDPGAGDTPGQGSNVTVDYSGYLQSDHSLFDSSINRGTPFRFKLGMGKVIRGWDEGVALMKTGAKYRFIIPAELGYGNRNMGPIPAGSTLIFDVELIDFN